MFVRVSRITGLCNGYSLGFFFHEPPVLANVYVVFFFLVTV